MKMFDEDEGKHVEKLRQKTDSKMKICVTKILKITYKLHTPHKNNFPIEKGKAKKIILTYLYT